jgi:hypothetical protein
MIVYPNNEDNPSRASSSFFSLFSSSSACFVAVSGAVAPVAEGAAAVVATVIGAAFKAASISTSPSAATRAFILTASGAEPVAFIKLVKKYYFF